MVDKWNIKNNNINNKISDKFSVGPSSMLVKSRIEDGFTEKP